MLHKHTNVYVIVYIIFVLNKSMLFTMFKIQKFSKKYSERKQFSF